MLARGDVVEIDFGTPEGSEAGMMRPAVVVSAARLLAAGPSVIQVVPLTRTLRRYASEVTVLVDARNGLRDDSAAQCQHIRAVATSRYASASATSAPSPSPRSATRLRSFSTSDARSETLAELLCIQAAGIGLRSS